MIALRRATYESRYGLHFVAQQLGDGKDGVVSLNRRPTAVKFFYNRDNYTRELRAYRALQVIQADEILGLHVPRLIRHDDELLAVEITVVTPPFLLDFASTYTDEELKWLCFTPEVWAERQAHWAEIFGARWPEAAAVRDAFRRLTGLNLLDVSLNNIRLA